MENTKQKFETMVNNNNISLQASNLKIEYQNKQPLKYLGNVKVEFQSNPQNYTPFSKSQLIYPEDFRSQSNLSSLTESAMRSKQTSMQSEFTVIIPIVSPNTHYLEKKPSKKFRLNDGLSFSRIVNLPENSKNNQLAMYQDYTTRYLLKESSYGSQKTTVQAFSQQQERILPCQSEELEKCSLEYQENSSKRCKFANISRKNALLSSQKYESLIGLISNPHFNPEMLSDLYQSVSFIESYSPLFVNTKLNVKQSENTNSNSSMQLESSANKKFNNAFLENNNRTSSTTTTKAGNTNNQSNLNTSYELLFGEKSIHDSCEQTINVACSKKGNNSILEAAATATSTEDDKAIVSQYLDSSFNKKKSSPLVDLIQFDRIESVIPHTEFTLTKEIRERILTKFTLFLRSDYRSLKFFDVDHSQTTTTTKTSSEGEHSTTEKKGVNRSTPYIPFDLFRLLEEQNLKEKTSFEVEEALAIHVNNTIPSSVNSTNKSTGNNKNSKKEESNEAGAAASTSGKTKQTLFNLSKYLMHLILELMSADHLSCLDIPQGFRAMLEKVVRRLKQKGQRTEHSQTFYYNHSHYNCLFLMLNELNLVTIANSKELASLHSFIFDVSSELSNPYTLVQINIVKSILAKCILTQLEFVQTEIDRQITEQRTKFRKFDNYITTKLMYFKRVLNGIHNLKNGNFLIRF